MRANYYRTSIRFQGKTTLKRLKILQESIKKEVGKTVPLSRLIETIVEQFLDRNVSEEEKSQMGLAKRKE